MGEISWGRLGGLTPLPFPQSSIMENILPRYCLNCKKLGKLILRKIIKIVATRCGILKLNCTKFDSVFCTSKGSGRKDGRKGQWGRERKGEGRVSPVKPRKPNFAHVFYQASPSLSITTATASRQFTAMRRYATRSTQPCIPPGLLNRVPASAGLRAGMSPLPGGR